MRAAPLWAALGAATAGAAAAPPNIIFILSDDLGYGDYSISPGVNRTRASIPTPNIQRMADSGLRLERAYTGPVCAPSRCTLATGLHQGHCTVRGNDGSYSPLLPADVTVAKVLQRTHVTGLVGKWGLGDFNTTGYPLAQGFDYFIGQDSQVACHDWYPTVLQNGTNGKQALNEASSLGKGCLLKPGTPGASRCTWVNDLVRTEGVAFIRGHAGGPKPFFLYLSSTTPHTGELKNYLGDGYPVPWPYNNASFLDPSWAAQQRHFASAVWAQDAIVGAVLDELEALHIAESTVVFFSGDNGPDSHDFHLFDDPGPFRGKKRSLHEGGIRQTIAVQWKGTIAPGSVSKQLFAFWDFLPTAAELAGIPPADWPRTDGVSIAPTLTGQGLQQDHEYLYWEFCDNSRVNGLLPQQYEPGWGQAVRFDAAGTEWKAIRSNSAATLLYNLTADIAESTDLAAEHPDVVAKVAELMGAAHEESDFWPSVQGPGQKCCAACFKHQGCAAPCKKL
eukprot:TRINITY_DN64788_c0_g1_i1.p1 TRINITY_DN64788_c0_g1~~TRINITY_DN64788_c0_g1_i1.p1  ORF type:complete len:538 (+),score=156.10 TRINITY_DN64788_c0_g1_i1:100-1614(+)